MNAHAVALELAAGDEGALIVGRQDTVHFRADSVSCIDGMMLKDPAGKALKAEWKTVKPNEVEVKLPLQDAEPGAMTLMITQFGVKDPQPIAIKAFSEAGRFEGFSTHAGDTQGLLKGSRLDEVASLSIGSVVFTPGDLSTRIGADELPMVMEDPSTAAAMKPDRTVAAKVRLKDGRVIAISASIDAPRPRAVLISKFVQPSPSIESSNIQLADPGELPLDATLLFSLRTLSPATFLNDESIEVATVDELSATILNLHNGGLTLENSQVALATINPGKTFGSSAFGPLRYRVNARGITGDWQPLATLVRLPALKDITCPAAAELACKLSGANLFLIDSLSSDAQFTHPVQVPDGFLGSALPVPHPGAGPFYLKLRDNPTVINPMTLTAEQLPATPADTARSATRQPALAANANGDNAAVSAGATSAPAIGSNQTTSTLATPPASPAIPVPPSTPIPQAASSASARPSDHPDLTSRAGAADCSRTAGTTLAGAAISSAHATVSKMRASSNPSRQPSLHSCS